MAFLARRMAGWAGNASRLPQRWLRGTCPCRRRNNADRAPLASILAAADMLSLDQLTGMRMPAAIAPGCSAQPVSIARLRTGGTSPNERRAVQVAGVPLPDARDMGLMILFALVLLVFLTLANNAGSSGRNPSADAIAQKFAAGSEGEEAEDVLEQRLDFAPRLRLPAVARADGARATPMRKLPFDELGAIVLRGLPVGARLSAGLPMGEGQWVVSQSDIDKLAILLPGAAQRVSAVRVEVIGRDGLSRGSFTLNLTVQDDAEAALRNSGSAARTFAGVSPMRTGALSEPAAANRAKPQAERRIRRRTGEGQGSARQKPQRMKPQPVPAMMLMNPASPMSLYTPAGLAPRTPAQKDRSERKRMP